MSVKGSTGRVERFSSALASLRSSASTGSLKNLVISFRFGLNWAWSGLGGPWSRCGERGSLARPPASYWLMETSGAPWGERVHYQVDRRVGTIVTRYVFRFLGSDYIHSMQSFNPGISKNQRNVFLLLIQTKYL